MSLSLGLHLVIVLPTLLFLIGFGLKAVIENKTRTLVKGLVSTEKFVTIRDESNSNFLFALAVDSIFLFVANGLILVFELVVVEIGIVAIIVGLLLSIFLLVGVYTNSGILNVIGVLGSFACLGGELGVFSAYGSGVSWGPVPLEVALFVVGAGGGAVAAFLTIATAFPEGKAAEPRAAQAPP